MQKFSSHSAQHQLHGHTKGHSSAYVSTLMRLPTSFSQISASDHRIRCAHSGQPVQHLLCFQGNLTLPCRPLPLFGMYAVPTPA